MRLTLTVIDRAGSVSQTSSACLDFNPAAHELPDLAVFTRVALAELRANSGKPANKPENAPSEPATSADVPEPTTTPEAKRALLQQLLDANRVVNIVVDRSLVNLPAYLTDIAIVLRLGWDLDPPINLALNTQDISCLLMFQDAPWGTRIPWRALIGVRIGDEGPFSVFDGESDLQQTPSDKPKLSLVPDAPQE